MIKISLEGIEGVKKAEVDIKYATIWHDPARVTVDQLVTVVTKAGKDCFPVKQ